MRRIARQALAADVSAEIRALTRALAEESDLQRRYDASGRLWKSREKVVQSLRETLRQMQRGASRCMYCEHCEGKDIEHFWPRRAYPERAFVWENLLLACSACNSTYKGDQFPMASDGTTPLLLDPTDQSVDPLDHLRLAPTTGRYAEDKDCSERGRVSIRVLGLNRTFLAETRSTAFHRLLRDLDDWCHAADAGHTVRADYIRSECQKLPHASVLRDLLRLIDRGEASELARVWRAAGRAVEADRLDASSRHLDRYPEIRGWCDEL